MIALRRTDVAKASIHHLETVSERESGYIPRELKRAKLARNLIKHLYYPSDATLPRTLVSGAIINVPVTANDIALATSIYGKDRPLLKGKAKDFGPVARKRNSGTEIGLEAAGSVR